MNVLVVNAGSSSLKYQLIETATGELKAKGICERIGQAGSVIEHKTADGTKITNQYEMPNHAVAMKYVVAALTNPETGCIKDMAEIEAVGHRVVHGGPYYSESCLVTPEVLEKLELCRDFAAGRYDRVGIVCTRYVSMLSQEAWMRPILPLQRKESAGVASVIFEPDEATVLEEAVPEYVAGLLVSAVRESFACEVAARRCAMDSAGKNAQQMIDDLQLEYNRARQGAITQEITEIVAGSGT